LGVTESFIVKTVKVFNNPVRIASRTFFGFKVDTSKWYAVRTLPDNQTSLSALIEDANDAVRTSPHPTALGFANALPSLRALTEAFGFHIRIYRSNAPR
jgi:hypothetical protein